MGVTLSAHVVLPSAARASLCSLALVLSALRVPLAVLLPLLPSPCPSSVRSPGSSSRASAAVKWALRHVCDAMKQLLEGAHKSNLGSSCRRISIRVAPPCSSHSHRAPPLLLPPSVAELTGLPIPASTVSAGSRGRPGANLWRSRPHTDPVPSLCPRPGLALRSASISRTTLRRPSIREHPHSGAVRVTDHRSGSRDARFSRRGPGVYSSTPLRTLPPHTTTEANGATLLLPCQPPPVPASRQQARRARQASSGQQAPRSRRPSRLPRPRLRHLHLHRNRHAPATAAGE
jgi:hypothetical protein